MTFGELAVGTVFRRDGGVLAMKTDTTFSKEKMPRNIVFLESTVGFHGHCEDSEEITEEPLNELSPFTLKAADKLAGAVNELIRSGRFDARSNVGDRLLDYASIRFGDRDPIGDLQRKLKE